VSIGERAPSVPIVAPVSAARPGVGRALAWAEAGAAIAAAPLLMFASPLSPVALVLLPLLWLARLLWLGAALRRTPADWPLAGLLLALPLSLYPSVDLALSRPKLYGLVLGLYLCALLVEHLGSRLDVRLYAAALVAGGVGVVAVALVGTNWSITKFAPLTRVYARLPQLIDAVPTSFGMVAGGLHPNEVGGTLALLAPLALALALSAGPGGARLAAAGAGMAMLGTLVLTASRSALTGVAVSLLALALLRWPRLVIALPAVVAGLCGALWWLGVDRVARSLLALDAAGDALARGRLLIWDRALAMIADAPLTGMGLNTFPVVANLLYPFYDLGPQAHVPHAHNLLLQVGVDLGVLGLASFVGILGAAAVSLGQAWRRAGGWERGLVAGLGAGLLAHTIFGLTDAVTLGAKPGVFLWAMLGGALALGSAARATTGGAASQAAQRRGASLLQWAHWALFTLACGIGALITLLPISVVS
jgi:putative inorganic carbon (HCO3(-)) transporter